MSNPNKILGTRLGSEREKTLEILSPPERQEKRELFLRTWHPPSKPDNPEMQKKFMPTMASENWWKMKEQKEIKSRPRCTIYISV